MIFFLLPRVCVMNCEFSIQTGRNLDNHSSSPVVATRSTNTSSAPRVLLSFVGRGRLSSQSRLCRSGQRTNAVWRDLLERTGDEVFFRAHRALPLRSNSAVVRFYLLLSHLLPLKMRYATVNI